MELQGPKKKYAFAKNDPIINQSLRFKKKGLGTLAMAILGVMGESGELVRAFKESNWRQLVWRLVDR